MKTKIPIFIETETEIRLVRIVAPVNYGEDEIPNDFPGRNRNTWTAEIKIDTGKILNWPVGRVEKMSITVKDGGVFTLIDPSGGMLAVTENNYVPHGVVPGKYGDTIELEIAADGTITNWPRRPNVSAWFGKE